jgi:hypothetical protein
MKLQVCRCAIYIIQICQLEVAATGLHKVRKYTHFVCINQLEDSLVWVGRDICILYWETINS